MHQCTKFIRKVKQTWFQWVSAPNPSAYRACVHSENVICQWLTWVRSRFKMGFQDIWPFQVKLAAKAPAESFEIPKANISWAQFKQWCSGRFGCSMVFPSLLFQWRSLSPSRPWKVDMLQSQENRKITFSEFAKGELAKFLESEKSKDFHTFFLEQKHCLCAELLRLAAVATLPPVWPRSATALTCAALGPSLHHGTRHTETQEFSVFKCERLPILIDFLYRNENKEEKSDIFWKKPRTQTSNFFFQIFVKPSGGSSNSAVSAWKTWSASSFPIDSLRTPVTWRTETWNGDGNMLD